MSTCSKLISSGIRRIVVDAKEPALVHDLIKSLHEDLSGMEVVVLDSAEEFASSALSHGMFDSSGRVLVLWDLNAENFQYVVQAMRSDTSDTLIAIQRKAIPKTRAYTQMMGDCETLSIQPLDERACVGYAGFVLKSLGCSYDTEVPSKIAQAKGKDVGAIRSEARKLSFLGRKIDNDTCAQLLGGGKGTKAFDLVEAVLRRRWGPALEMASTSEVSEMISFLHLMQSQVQKLYLALIHKESGMSNDDIATVISVPPFIARTKILPVATQLGKGRVLKLMDLISAADIQARVSRLPKRELFEVLVIKLMRV
jgi:DNA polymerase III delta subunit